MGGVGTSQTVKAVGKYQTVWEVLAGFRLTVRNIEVAASTHIDGGVCCISGRTAAYRTRILKDPRFIYEFTNDLWLGKYPLNSGDDKFLTRWMVKNEWNTYIQVCPEAELLSTFKNNSAFPQTGSAVDAQHLAQRLQIALHRTRHLATPSVRRVHND